MKGSVRKWRCARSVSIGLYIALVLYLPSSAVSAEQSAHERITLYGIRLTATPERQVVPRDIATIVSTLVQAPTLPDGYNAIPDDAEVRATLRGPSLKEPLEHFVGDWGIKLKSG